MDPYMLRSLIKYCYRKLSTKCRWFGSSSNTMTANTQQNGEKKKWFSKPLGTRIKILKNYFIQGPPNNFFPLENFFFYLKVQSFRLIMKNNFIQTATSAGHAVAYTTGPIFQHIIDCVQLYFTNGFTNIVL